MKDPCTMIGSFGPFVLWHRDRDGRDGACGWFMRASHGDAQILKRIESMYSMEWDHSIRLHDGTDSPLGLFDSSPFGWPVMSIHAIALNLFYWAALEHFGNDRKKAVDFMKRYLFEILFFAEKPVDSACHGWLHRFGVNEKETRQDRIHDAAVMIYGWILREDRPWYRHPRWHIHHWRMTFRTPSWLRKLTTDN